MPVIKARTRGKHIIRHITRLDRENVETLYAYATFLAEPPEYVLNQVIETLLARDREFVTWREANPGPHTPRPTAAKGQPRRRPDVHANLPLTDSGKAGARGAASAVN
jgi:hypothetical protein